MRADGSLDYAAYRSLIDWHVQEGTDALVVVGTTGESPTVSMEEHAELIRVAVEHAAGRIPVIAGVGANSTDEAIHLTRHAKVVGAQAGLSVVPYYNKPSQEGLYRHFRAIAEAVDLPTILYNVPGRTVADMSNETVLRLAQVPGIIGIKDATGDIARRPAVARGAGQLPGLQRRRSHRGRTDPAGRARQYFRDRQRGAAPDARAMRGRPGWRRAPGA